MLQRQILRVPVVVECSQLDNNVDNAIKQQIQKLELRTFKNVGIVIKINELLSITGGDVQLDTGTSKFMVDVEVFLYAPKVYDIITSKITMVVNLGIFINDYPDSINWDGIFVQFKPVGYKVGDTVTVKITQVKYREQMVVTGVLVEPNGNKLEIKTEISKSEETAIKIIKSKDPSEKEKVIKTKKLSKTKEISNVDPITTPKLVKSEETTDEDEPVVKQKKPVIKPKKTITSVVEEAVIEKVTKKKITEKKVKK